MSRVSSRHDENTMETPRANEKTCVCRHCVSSLGTSWGCRNQLIQGSDICADRVASVMKPIYSAMMF
eukprot:2094641-Karenia_brevis.AAC.1